MTPKRKPRDANDSTTTAGATTRVTRSSARRANVVVVADPEQQKKKKAKTTAAAKEDGEAETEYPAAEKKPESPGGSKTIVIEHCKQCNSFKTRAIQVKIGVEKGVDGVKVVVNPEKPRRGCFEIREEGGGTFISLLDMKRPFKPMKDLDMERVISDIVEKIR